jgi:hypothetical protein
MHNAFTQSADDGQVPLTSEPTNATTEQREHSIAAMESAIRKSESCLVSMSESAPARSGLQKRLAACKIGLGAMHAEWDDAPLAYDADETLAAKLTIQKMLAQLPKHYEKAKEGSPQRTTIARRMMAFKYAIEFLDVRLADR